jgi:hypothetical protein
MSKFYQRYVSGVKKDESSSSLIGASKTRPVDPTAMTPSHAARPASSRVAGASSASVTASGPAPARRVQIFNSSDSFSPDEQRQLAVFNKPEAAKAFLRGAIGAHYLFESLGPEDLNRIIDCMKPTFATANEQIIKQGELGVTFFWLIRRI